MADARAHGSPDLGQDLTEAREIYFRLLFECFNRVTCALLCVLSSTPQCEAPFFFFEQEQWQRQVQSLLAELPDRAAGEEAFLLAVEKVRASIAGRWLHILKLNGLLPKAEFDSAVASAKSHIESLIEIHGQRIPFCLDPSEKIQESLGSAGQKQETEGGSTSKSTSSSCSVLPHEFKFVQTTDNSVWSVVKAGRLSVKFGFRFGITSLFTYCLFSQ